MGGLSHFVEQEGVPTTHISLIRLHSEKIRPPRALWVPFELGRPLGAPNDPLFQKRVIIRTLGLLEAAEGPVLEDFPDEAPPSGDHVAVLSCPVDFGQEDAPLTETGRMCQALKREMRSLRPWYDVAVKKRGRTTVGVSGMDSDAIPDFLCSFLDGALPESPREGLSLSSALNLATDDLKAFYFEAITSQPGQESPSSTALSDWFWGQTTAGEVLLAVREICAESEDSHMKRVGTLLIVPIDQAHRSSKRPLSGKRQT